MQVSPGGQRWRPLARHSFLLLCDLGDALGVFEMCPYVAPQRAPLGEPSVDGADLPPSRRALILTRLSV